MSNLVVIQEPENCSIHEGRDSNYHDTKVATVWKNFLPYGSKNWIEKVKHFGVTIPEEYANVLDRSMGTSTCEHCGYTVAGQQTTCTNHVHKFRTEGSYSWHSFELQPLDKPMFVGDLLKDSRGYNSRKVSEVKFDVCVSRMKWNLQEKFDEQEQFYQFLEALVIDTTSPFAKFGHLMADPKDAQIIQLKQQVEMMRINENAIRNALMMIKEKMNNAGSSLIFNF
jgi:hypothetical protein